MAALSSVVELKRVGPTAGEDSDYARRRRLRMTRVDDLSEEQFRQVLAQVEVARSEVVTHTKRMRQNILQRVQSGGLFRRIMTDAETGLYNRKFLEIVAPMAVRELRTCALVRVKVEGPATESQFFQVAEALRRMAQPQDLVVRAGRDLFVLLTPDQAVSLESLRERLGREAGGVALRVTLARKGQGCDELWDLLDAAER